MPPFERSFTRFWTLPAATGQAHSLDAFAGRLCFTTYDLRERRRHCV